MAKHGHSWNTTLIHSRAYFLLYQVSYSKPIDVYLDYIFHAGIALLQEYDLRNCEILGL